MFRLDDKNVAVIGAGAGIGAAVARACAQQGAGIACLDVDADAAAATAAEIMQSEGSASSSSVDVREGESVRQALSAVVDERGSLDVVVCTPGVNVRKPLLDYTGEEFDRVVEINLKGALHVLQAAGRIMTDAGRGSIILFSSIRSQVVEPGQGVYAATKAGIVQMARTAAAEFGPRGVRVNAIAPGVVDTPLTAPIKANEDWYSAYADRSILKRWAAPEEIAGAAVYLASDAASYVTGSLLVVDGGWTAVDGRFDPPGA